MVIKTRPVPKKAVARPAARKCGHPWKSGTARACRNCPLRKK